MGRLGKGMGQARSVSGSTPEECTFDSESWEKSGVPVVPIPAGVHLALGLKPGSKVRVTVARLDKPRPSTGFIIDWMAWGCATFVAPAVVMPDGMDGAEPPLLRAWNASRMGTAESMGRLQALQRRVSKPPVLKR